MKTAEEILTEYLEKEKSHESNGVLINGEIYLSASECEYLMIKYLNKYLKKCGILAMK